MSELKIINPKVGFNQVLKSPSTYVLILAMNIVLFFVYKYADRSDEVVLSKDKEIHQLREDKKDLMLEVRRKDKENDSLQGLIIKRGDNSYEELKNMLDINNRESTIIIKPKRK